MIIKENVDCSAKILDIGAGSGCIAISLAKNLPQAKVSSWDVSDEALKVARENNEKLGVSVTFSKVDVLGYKPFGE